MKDTRMYAFLRSFTAALLVLVMSLSMSVFAFADEADMMVEDGDVAVDSTVEATDDAAGAEEEEAESNDAPAESVAVEGSDAQSEISLIGFYRDGRYVDYYSKYQEHDVVLPEIIVEGNAVAGGTAPYKSVDSYERRDQVLVMTDTGSLIYKVEVPQTGLYALELEYFPLLGDGNGKDYEISVKVDGKLPHDDALRFILKRNWGDEGGKRVFDEVGNELFAKQVEVSKWLSKSLRDPDGVFDDPVKFYLTKGTHELEIGFTTGIMALDHIRLHNSGAAMSYADYIALNDANGAQNVEQEFTLETENYVDKSDSLIQPAYDRSDPKVSPYSISKTRMNVLGGENWNKNGQTVNWTIDVPADGYYTVGVRYRQSYVADSTSFRKILIDGKVPFAEAATVGFPFEVGYRYKKLGGVDAEGKSYDYKFYLTKGKHEFSLEAIIGPMAGVSREAEDIVYQLNYIYRKIIIVTGTQPDTYRDYELDRRVEGLEEMFGSVLEDLVSIENQILELNGTLGSASCITTLKKQLQDFIDAPYSIPDRLSTFKDNISTLSSWMLDLRKQPLQIDKIIFTGEGMKATRQTANFGESIAHEVRAFWSSFVDDYTSVGATSESGRNLVVWVGTGRDQAMVLKTLCDNYFTPQTDISVNVSLVPLAILSKAIVAGRGPDIALHVSRSEPMNLGVRDAVYDISQFEDYDEVVKRFTEYAMVPYTLSTKDDEGNDIQEVYALPETQNFNMMFYRTDIFAELGISAPNTWDDFDNILPFIQANNMTVGIDSSLFYTFILQSGNTPYAADGTITNFTKQFAVDAFEKWTRYYLQYDLPVDYSWYTRFRNGEMPLVLTTYSNITYLQESAPELNGLWNVSPVPGTLDEETGIVNRTEESVGLTACMIVSSTIEQAKNPEQQLEDAWTFMKWWTSAEIMADYGNRVEMAIGSVARYTTANYEAFEKIKWSAAEAAAIKEQRQWIRETPELVGGYYVQRNITNAFRNVTNNHSNPREKLFYYNEQINDEIWRKRSEYHLSVPEEAKK